MYCPRCEFCGNIIDCGDEYLHDACEDFYKFLLEEVITKTELKLKICKAIQASFESKNVTQKINT